MNGVALLAVMAALAQSQAVGPRPPPALVNMPAVASSPTAPAPMMIGIAPPAPAGDVVVVTAHKAEVIAQFVQQFAVPTGQDALMSRWDGQVCSGVVGLEKKYSEYLNDKLAETAIKVGLKVGEPGCQPDILVVVTPEAAPLMQALSHYERRLAARPGVGDTASGGSSRQTFGDFLKGTRPVSWWHVSERVAADTGMSIGGTMKVFSPSRLRSTTRESFRHVLIIVDAKRAQGVSYEALASYIAMASLAQLAPDAPVGKLPTIMSLFADRDAGRPSPTTLTNWDIAYLKGLYGSRAEAPDVNAQRRDIVSAIQASEKQATH